MWVCKGLLCLCFWKAFNHDTKPFNHHKKRKEKIKASPKGYFLLQMLVPISNCKCKGLQGGSLCGPGFYIFQRILEKETNCFGEGSICEFVFFSCSLPLLVRSFCWLNTKSPCPAPQEDFENHLAITFGMLRRPLKTLRRATGPIVSSIWVPLRRLRVLRSQRWLLASCEIMCNLLQEPESRTSRRFRKPSCYHLWYA